jgi:hypothetical protein
MITILIHPRNAWNDHFPGTSPTTTLSSQTPTSRQTPSGSNVYVSNCLFGPISSSSAGGALYCSSSATYLVVESSSFFSCKTSSGNGGAILFYHTSGQCVLYRVCGYDCCCGSRGMFSYITVSSTASSKSYVNYSSITRCVTDSTSPVDTLGHQNGKICYPSVNSSLNKCYRMTGVTSWPTKDSNSVTCSLTYCTVADNHATGYNCIMCETEGVKNEIKCCNILRNTQVSLNEQATIWVRGNLMIEDSCILENNANFIFHAYSSTITLSNCTVDSTSKTGNVVTQNTVTKSFILALNHISTQNCHSEYDSAGTLTPIIQTPSSSMKEMRCNTCGRYFNQLPPQIFLFFVSFYFSI